MKFGIPLQSLGNHRDKILQSIWVPPTKWEYCSEVVLQL